jgi:DNA-binding transcriptional MerR regulator
MRLVKANEVQRLTGLSADQLREWTVRRGLIEPDAKPHGPGSRALFSWQTVLLLRIAMSLKERFHVELQSQRVLFAALSRRLHQASFPSLGGSALVIAGDGSFDLLELEKLALVEGDVLILQLDPHLELLAAEFALVEPMSQLPLFPVLAVA